MIAFIDAVLSLILFILFLWVVGILYTYLFGKRVDNTPSTKVDLGEVEKSVEETAKAKKEVEEKVKESKETIKKVIDRANELDQKL